MTAEEILDGVIKDLALSYRQKPDPIVFEKILYRLDNLILRVVNVTIKRCPHLTNEDPEDLYRVAILGLYKGLTTVKDSELSYITIARLMAYMKCEIKKTFPYKVLPEGYILSQNRVVLEETVYQNLEFEFIQNILNELVKEDIISKSDLLLLEKRYLNSWSCQELADVFGCSVSKVRKDINDILTVVRYQLRIRGITGF